MSEISCTKMGEKSLKVGLVSVTVFVCVQAARAAWGSAGNLVLSPVVVLLNLGSVYVNCRGETEEELAKALRWTHGKEAFKRGAEDLLAALVVSCLDLSVCIRKEQLFFFVHFSNIDYGSYTVKAWGEKMSS